MDHDQHPVPMLWRGFPLQRLDDVPESAVRLVISRPEIKPVNVKTNTTALFSILTRVARVLQPGGVLALCLPATVKLDGAAFPLTAWATYALAEAGLSYRDQLAVAAFHPTGYVQDSEGPWGEYCPAYEPVLLATKGTYLARSDDTKLEADTPSLFLNVSRDKLGRDHGIGGIAAGHVLRLYTQRGDVVLDTHAGLGTVGKAILKLGRVPWLIEQDPKYWPFLDLVVQQPVLTEDALPVAPIQQEIALP